MSERRWALLIAIDAYPYLAADVQLHGCVNDQLAWHDLLTTSSAGFAFPAAGITQLKNETATHDGILAAASRSGTLSFSARRALSSPYP